jgi:hypothetical protein
MSSLSVFTLLIFSFSISLSVSPYLFPPLCLCLSLSLAACRPSPICLLPLVLSSLCGSLLPGHDEGLAGLVQQEDEAELNQLTVNIIIS